MALLQRWLPDDSPPPLMALSSIGCDGYPRVRHVLLSAADETSVWFHTDARSSKVAELAETPRAAVSLVWPHLGRQVVAYGDVRQAPEDELRDAYARRSRYLQLLAWCNDAASSMMTTEERRRRWADFDRAHPVLTPPETWTGYAIDLREITFWRGDPDGPSQRVRFARPTADTEAADTTWTSEVLPG